MCEYVGEYISPMDAVRHLTKLAKLAGGTELQRRIAPLTTLDHRNLDTKEYSGRK